MIIVPAWNEFRTKKIAVNTHRAETILPTGNKRRRSEHIQIPDRYRRSGDAAREHHQRKPSRQHRLFVVLSNSKLHFLCFAICALLIGK